MNSNPLGLDATTFQSSSSAMTDLTPILILVILLILMISAVFESIIRKSRIAFWLSMASVATAIMGLFIMTKSTDVNSMAEPDVMTLMVMIASSVIAVVSLVISSRKITYSEFVNKRNNRDKDYLKFREWYVKNNADHLSSTTNEGNRSGPSIVVHPQANESQSLQDHVSSKAAEAMSSISDHPPIPHNRSTHVTGDTKIPMETHLDRNRPSESNQLDINGGAILPPSISSTRQRRRFARRDQA